MSFAFQCDCGSPLSAASGAESLPVRCGRCGAVYTIRLDPAPGGDPTPVPVRRQQRRMKRARTRTSDQMANRIMAGEFANRHPRRVHWRTVRVGVWIVVGGAMVCASEWGLSERVTLRTLWTLALGLAIVGWGIAGHEYE